LLARTSRSPRTHAARGGEYERHRHVGGVFGQHARRVGHGDAALARGIEIDVIDAGAEGGDQLQTRAGLAQHPAVDAVGHGGHQHVGGLYRVDQLGGGKRRILDIEAGLEQLHEPRLDRVGQPPGDDHQRLFLGARGHMCPIAIPLPTCPAERSPSARKARLFKCLSSI
jgi:hypothetical protein